MTEQLSLSLHFGVFMVYLRKPLIMEYGTYWKVFLLRQTRLAQTARLFQCHWALLLRKLRPRPSGVLPASLQCRRPGFDPWVRKITWRRKCQPSPGFLPGESHGQRRLAGYSPWGCKESDTTERLHTRQQQCIPLRSVCSCGIVGACLTF